MNKYTCHSRCSRGQFPGQFILIQLSLDLRQVNTEDIGSSFDIGRPNENLPIEAARSQ